jgi:hypothetical protein
MGTVLPSLTAEDLKDPRRSTALNRVTIFRPGCFGRPGASMPAAEAASSVSAQLWLCLSRNQRLPRPGDYTSALSAIRSCSSLVS